MQKTREKAYAWSQSSRSEDLEAKQILNQILPQMMVGTKLLNKLLNLFVPGQGWWDCCTSRLNKVAN